MLKDLLPRVMSVALCLAAPTTIATAQTVDPIVRAQAYADNIRATTGECSYGGCGGTDWLNPAKRYRSNYRLSGGGTDLRLERLDRLNADMPLDLLEETLRTQYLIDDVPLKRLMREAELVYADLRNRRPIATMDDWLDVMQPAMDVALEERAAFFATALSADTKTDLVAYMNGLSLPRYVHEYRRLFDVLNTTWHEHPDAPVGSADAAVRKALKLSKAVR